MSRFRGRHNPRSRRLFMAALDAALLRGLFAKWSYRFGFHGRFTVSTHEVRVTAEDKLPRPLVVAFASDLHAGPATHPKVFTTLLDELTARAPDVVLLGGDYVSSNAKQIDVLCEALSRCHPPLGKYGVLGNHDLWTDDSHIVRQLSGAGVEVLVNQSRSLPPPFESVSVCGVDDPWTGSADLTRTFADAGPIRVFLSHSPDGLLLMNGERFDVGFAGHTHGGQIAFSNGTPLMSAGGPLSRQYGRGRFEIPGNGSLIVSRGFGNSTLPIRINADPELVICTLRP
jgi:predicted MPP superfamily phosphohydrolase